MHQRRMNVRLNVGVWLLTTLIGLWQLSAPLRTPRCRFAPSCSYYAVEALRIHGFFRGSYLAGRRLLRCHPWNPGGVDHVPPAQHAATSSATAVDDGIGPRG
ncbi:MAG: membrane protein insertion efficiency factor YidD [Nitriliruptoraceae bacterium]